MARFVPIFALVATVLIGCTATEKVSSGTAPESSLASCVWCNAEKPKAELVENDGKLACKACAEIH